MDEGGRDEPDGDAAGLDALAGELRDADTAAALTGAGVSAASGVPTFRGDDSDERSSSGNRTSSGDGIWGGEFDPADFRYGRFGSDPAGFWADRIELRSVMRPDGLAPNAAHRALADLESAGVLDAVVTQNTDGLHAGAGSDRVVELHGSAARVACQGCGRRVQADPVFERARDGELPPTCGECGGVYKPDVVLFGESMPDGAMAEARGLAEDADVFLAVGSSLTVEPAASLPRIAARDGTLAVVNLDSTPHDGRADHVFRADVTELLPDLVERVTG
ncbi:NAD-dependent protein deacetylase [Halobacteriales archaeon QS_8_69_26]|nr:MAG: NAD-dependent protein deacetylase [Halobacteriales archaeon QS_8_69_26]